MYLGTVKMRCGFALLEKINWLVAVVWCWQSESKFWWSPTVICVKTCLKRTKIIKKGPGMAHSKNIFLTFCSATVHHRLNQINSIAWMNFTYVDAFLWRVMKQTKKWLIFRKHNNWKIIRISVLDNFTDLRLF